MVDSKRQKPIYLDYNATTPLAPQVFKAMLQYMQEDFGNPSSMHAFGVKAKQGVERARSQVAHCIGANAEEIVFTGSGSEANNFAIKGVAFANKTKGNHLITSTIEHPAVMEVMRYLENNGFKVTYVGVDGNGMVDPADVEAAITPLTILISIMHANNEIGTIQPITEIAHIAHAHGVIVHTDAAQSVGKISVNVQKMDVDLLSIAGHKLYAPKGIGALFVRNGVTLEKLIHGAEHEMDRRAGTENVIEIAALGAACDLISEHLGEYQHHFAEIRDHLEDGLHKRFPQLKVNGHPSQRLPNTSNVSFKGLEANTILSELTGVAASAGAACHSDRVDVSPVIQAMGIPLEYAMGTIRFSVGRNTTVKEIDAALKLIEQVIKKMQPNGGSSPTPDSENIRLTQYTHGLGCACKLRPQLLEKILQDLPLPKDKNILVGTETGDDAAVYMINDSIALVQTVDFFTPIVDDPYQFGMISAANSLSDIYAMGAKPIFALNIVGFPSNRLPISVLGEILQGALEKTSEAGIAIIGGHTVDDVEPKFGLAVTGVVHPKKVITNRHARQGDDLILTKAVGTGIIATALKQGFFSQHQAQTAIQSMSSLNYDACEAMQEVGVNACTDVTGFGLMGHLMGMMQASQTSSVIQSELVPVLDGTRDLVAAGIVPGGTKNNLDYTAHSVFYQPSISQVTRIILNDAQTSGGLLISVPPEKTKVLLDNLKNRGVKIANKIGTVKKEGKWAIEVF